jgi:hypothetical protein
MLEFVAHRIVKMQEEVFDAVKKKPKSLEITI